MNDLLQPAVSIIQARFGATAEEFRQETTLFVAAKDICAALLLLRDECGFNMLADLTAVDYWPQEQPRFHLVYQLYSMPKNLALRVRVALDGNAPEIATVEGVYPNANWYEREVFDLFGVKFDGHSDLRRIVMPGDWQGHPLRKDYPLGYEEVQFSFNKDEVMLHKPKGKL